MERVGSCGETWFVMELDGQLWDGVISDGERWFVIVSVMSHGKGWSGVG